MVCCQFCQWKTIETNALERSKLIDNVPSEDGLRCSKCNRFACRICLGLISQRIIESGVKDDRWTMYVRSYLTDDVFDSQGFIGSCCEFDFYHSYNRNVRTSNTKPSNTIKPSNAIKPSHTINPSIELLSGHNDCNTNNMKCNMSKRRRGPRKRKSKTKRNNQYHLDGHLYLPELNLLIDSPFNSVDIHGFASIDKWMPGLWHCVLSEKSAKEAMEHNVTPVSLETVINPTKGFIMIDNPFDITKQLQVNETQKLIHTIVTKYSILYIVSKLLDVHVCSLTIICIRSTF